MKELHSLESLLLVAFLYFFSIYPAAADEPQQGDVKILDLGQVDHFGEKGRNGFGLADMCGGVWEFTLDHFDPDGGHEDVHYADTEQLSVSRPVCRGGNYFDVPGSARCAVRLGIASVSYSDSRDGFRICLATPAKSIPVIQAIDIDVTEPN